MVLVTLVAAAGWLFTKNALADFDPYTFVGVRFLVAGAVLASLFPRELARMPRAQHGTAIAVSCIQGAAMLVWIHAMSTAELIGEGAFIVSLSVVFMPVIGRILFGDPISPRLVVALPVAVAGLALLSLDGGFAPRASQWGFLVSSMGFSLHMVVTARVARTLPAMPLATWQLAVGGLFGCAAALAAEPLDLHVPPRAWVWLALSALVSSSLRFALQTRAIAHLSPTQIGMIMVLEPVWVTMLGGSLLGEHMPSSKIAGCAMILGALLIYRATWPRRDAAR